MVLVNHIECLWVDEVCGDRVDFGAVAVRGQPALAPSACASGTLREALLLTKDLRFETCECQVGHLRLPGERAGARESLGVVRCAEGTEYAVGRVANGLVEDI